MQGESHKHICISKSLTLELDKIRNATVLRKDFAERYGKLANSIEIYETDFLELKRDLTGSFDKINHSIEHYKKSHNFFTHYINRYKIFIDRKFASYKDKLVKFDYNSLLNYSTKRRINNLSLDELENLYSTLLQKKKKDIELFLFVKLRIYKVRADKWIATFISRVNRIVRSFFKKLFVVKKNKRDYIRKILRFLFKNLDDCHDLSFS